MNSGISRRQLLRLLAVASGSLGLGKVLAMRPGEEPGLKKTFLPTAYHGIAPPTATKVPTPSPTPTATSTPIPPSARVVHVQGAGATFWDFGSSYYGDYVNQSIVDAMVDRGVRELTGAATVAEAWQSIVPGYTPGKAIVLKVNFNNCRWCDSGEPSIDALPHPINSIVSGLLQAYADFDPQDMWVYEATVGYEPPMSPRAIPQRFKANCVHPFRFFDASADLCSEVAGYDSGDPSAMITWRNPPEIPTPPAMQVTDVLVAAQYVINMPIMKKHVNTGATLSFKNHFGSIANCYPLHDWIKGGFPYYGGTAYNPMVDIYRNPNIAAKTVLTMGDGLFGNWDNNIGKPAPWVTFGNSAPNSLLFSTDPVAIDSVLTDLIDAETSMAGWGRDHLIYAESVGLGTFELGDPWGSGYDQIDYVKILL